MPMPETAMQKYRATASRKNDIGLTYNNGLIFTRRIAKVAHQSF
jgi:hypothetical protein